MNDDLDEAILDADATGLVESEKLITDAETLGPLIELQEEGDGEQAEGEEPAPEDRAPG